MNFLCHILAAAPKTFLLPKAGSTSAFVVDVDWAWNVILWVTGIFFCIVVGAMTLFVFKYRRRDPNAGATSEVTHNTPLEIAWTFIPLVLVMIFFYIGFKGFMNFDNPVAGCTQIEVIGQQWKFTFNYPNGATDSDLYVLEGQPVQLNMHSVDVLHALYLPTFRTQRNLIPYRQTTLWFIPTETTPAPTQGDAGGWPIFCTQHCGNGHSKMVAHVYVLSKDKFDEKMKELANPFKKKTGEKSAWVPYVDLGKTLYSQMGCNTCHSLTGAAGTGPTWAGITTRDHEFTNAPGFKATELSDEQWDEYIGQSITNPDAKLVKLNGINYHGMPSSYTSTLGGSPENIEKQRAVIEFIKTVGNPSYKSAIPPDSELYDADKYPEFHPESLAAKKAKEAPATPPAGQ